MRMVESDIAWSAAQPSTIQDEQRLTLLGGDRFRPGDTVRFCLKADRWPDPKVTGLDVEVAYLSTFVEEWEAQPETPTGQLFAPTGVQTREQSSASTLPDRTVVARGTIEPGALDPTGRIAGTFTLPDPCPPTVADFSVWLVDVHVHRHHGLDKHWRASLRVLTGPAEQVISSRPTAAEHPSDWIQRVVGHHLGAAQPSQAASIEAPAVAAPGSLLTGSVTVRPHLAVAQMSRKVRKQADETGQVTLRGLTVALECWRGALARDAFQRMWRDEVTIEATVALDESSEVPFEIVLPESVQLAPTTERRLRPGPTPPTFFGSTFGALTLDDVRWRLVTQLRTSAQDTQAPFWATTEVLVISPPDSVPLSGGLWVPPVGEPSARDGVGDGPTRDDPRSGEASRRSLRLRGLIDEEPGASVPVPISSGPLYKRQELDVSRARRAAVKADRRGARVMGVFMLLAGVFGAWLFWPSENDFDKVLMTVGPTTVTWAFPLLVLVLVSASFGLAGLALVVRPPDSTRFDRDDAGSTGGLHADRGDGYCAHCYQPWPCDSRRE